MAQISLIELLRDFSEMMEENFRFYAANGDPKDPEYPIRVGSSPANMCAILNSYCATDPRMARLKACPYRIIFARDFRFMDDDREYQIPYGEVDFMVTVSMSHPLFDLLHTQHFYAEGGGAHVTGNNSYAAINATPVASGTIGGFKRKRIAGSKGNDMLFEHLELSKDKILRELGFDLPLDECIKKIDQFFYKQYASFFDHLSIFDKLMDTHPESERLQFAEDFTKVCYDLQEPCVGTLDDILLTDGRKKVLERWADFRVVAGI
jgi:hypothetical protein